MADSLTQTFGRYAIEDMTARGFRHVVTCHPANRDAAILMFSTGVVPACGPAHVIIVTVTGLELMQNADRLPELARARVAEAAAAYRQEHAA